MWLPFGSLLKFTHASMHVEVRPNSMRQIKMLGKTRTQGSFHFSEVVACFTNPRLKKKRVAKFRPVFMFLGSMSPKA
jgi:hypothetical protein